MSGPEIDYAAVFEALPAPILLLTPELTIIGVNEIYCRMAGREREELIGRYLFDAFPDNPADPDTDGASRLHASLLRVLSTKERDTMALQRYDVEAPGRPGAFEERYWSPVNVPVLGPAGDVSLIVHRVEEVTEFIRGHEGPDDERRQVMAAELYARTRELQELNERLRRAHERERQVALTLQEAMLPAPEPIRRGEAAVRYLPAKSTLNVCGDWYDLIDLPGERFAVAVGDVVGHGLFAAGVMGQLRSALTAAIRVADGPARALDVLGLYSRSVDGAQSSTAVQVVIDCRRRTIDYSCAGHPPPVLSRADGTVEFLDQATDPPLGARPEHLPRPQARTSFTDGSTLVLYTDGLIERRGEDIYDGLARLAENLVRHARLKPEALADTLLAELSPVDGPTDDIALVVIGL